MSFYPQKELNKQLILKYKVLGITCAIHLIIILAIFISSLFSPTEKLLINLSATTRKGASVYFNASRRSQISQAAFIKADKIEPKIDKAETAPKKTESKKIQQKVQKQVATKQISTPLVKEYTLLPKRIKNIIKEIKEPEKKIEQIKPVEEVVAKQETVQEEKVDKVENLPAQVISNLVIGANIDLSSETSWLAAEIKNNLSIPPGFEEHEPITITFEIDALGQISYFSPIKENESPALYMALKDCIFKCHFPKEKWGTKIELIYKSK